MKTYMTLTAVSVISLAACAKAPVVPLVICDREAQVWDKYETVEDKCVTQSVPVPVAGPVTRIDHSWGTSREGNTVAGVVEDDQEVLGATVLIDDSPNPDPDAPGVVTTTPDTGATTPDTGTTTPDTGTTTPDTGTTTPDTGTTTPDTGTTTPDTGTTTPDTGTTTPDTGTTTPDTGTTTPDTGTTTPDTGTTTPDTGTTTPDSGTDTGVDSGTATQDPIKPGPPPGFVDE